MSQNGKDVRMVYLESFRFPLPVYYLDTFTVFAVY